jgi:glycosyltransferase involved in cell wall biosynthesis
MDNSTLTLAYVTEGNAKDIFNGSGTAFFIAEALKKQGIELYYIDNLVKKKHFFTHVADKFFTKIINIFTGKQYSSNRTVKISKMFAKEIEKRLPENIDCIFIPFGTIPMAFLRSNVKKIIYNDATFASMINYYPGFSNLCSKTLREGNIIDKNAFENADLLIFSSDWAAQSAIHDYNINQSKIKVIPFGANIENEYTESEISEIIENRCNEKCNLLFVGVDWERKGGNIALEIANKLHSQNINIHLDIVGIKDMPISLPDFVTNHGFISKKTDDGMTKIMELYKNARFFIFPTRQECTAIVFSEAASFALPVITTKTGGTETIIKDNINGMTFNLSDSPEKYAEYIKRLISNQDEYKKLCFSAFNDYKERLNWNVAGKQIVNSIKEIL